MSMIPRLWLPPRVPMGNFPDLSPWSAGGVFPRRPPPTSDAGKHANESHHQIGDSFVLHTSTAQRRIPPINRLAPEMQNIPRSWGSELAELSISRGSGHLYSAARPQRAVDGQGISDHLSGLGHGLPTSRAQRPRCKRTKRQTPVDVNRRELCSLSHASRQHARCVLYRLARRVLYRLARRRIFPRTC